MKTNENKIVRCYNFSMRTSKDANEKGIIEGRPVVYDSKTDLGWFDEIIDGGALDSTDLKDIRFLVNHDISMIPLARSRNNNENSTMYLEKDEKGLKIRLRLDIENNSEARNLYSAVERGDIDGMSFMFDVGVEEWENEDTEHPTRHIKSISKIYEVSAVTFPAYEETEINARCKMELENFKLSLDSESRNTLDSESNNLIDKNNHNNELELLKLKTITLSK